MGDEIESLRAEVAALRAELAEERAGREQAITRRRLLTGLAGLGAAGAAGIANAPSARATDDTALVVGQANTSEDTTSLTQTPTADEDPALSIRTSGGLALFATTSPTGEPIVGNVQRAIYAAAGEPADGFAVANAISAFAGHGFSLEGVNESPAFPTVAGTNQGAGPGLGAASFGHGAQLLLFREDLAPAGPPTVFSEVGSVRFDGAGDLWLCLESGTPGTWTRLLREDTTPGRVIPITPFRALDTRDSDGRVGTNPAITGQRSGPIHGGETVTLQLRDHPDIPATATGVFGSLAVVRPNYTGSCRVMPSGTDSPASAVNFTKGIGALSNAYTSALGPAGLSLKPSGTAAHETHLILDVAGYLT